MNTAIRTACPDGYDIIAITAEAIRTRGLPGIVIVGLGDTSVQESRERVRAAILASGRRTPRGRLVVNLAPSGTRKRGTGLDLSIALALLGLDEPIARECPAPLVIGELGLDGSIRAAEGLPGLVQMALGEGRRLILPDTQAALAARIEGLRYVSCSTLDDALAAMQDPGRYTVGRDEPISAPMADREAALVLAAQPVAGLAMLAMAAGGHHTLISGPSGSGKSLLASAARWLMPPLEADERLTHARVAHWAGLAGPEQLLSRDRPFRAPHHGITATALLGGGTHARPGEVSLAHMGVLFLDELGERPRTTLDLLREPMDSGVIPGLRPDGRTVLPAAFTLLLAGTPCPCGRWGQADGACQCLSRHRDPVAGKLSSGLRDRLDLRVMLGSGEPEDVMHGLPQPEDLPALVREARARQRHWSARTGGCAWQGRMSREELDLRCPRDDAARQLEEHLRRSGASRRTFTAIRRVALTLANLAGRPTPDEEDLGRATLLRQEAWPDAMLS